MSNLQILLVFALAFFIGSIPFGYLLGKLKGVDLREEGSGNTGATNAARVLGKSVGIFTLLLDTAKGIIGVSLFELSSVAAPEFATTLLGLFVVAGHCYSPFLNFSGGKGVATALGVFIVLSPKAVLFAMVIFASVIWITGYVSVASMLASLTMPVLIVGTRASTDVISIEIVTFISLLIVARHRQNIRRLRAGKEPSFIKKT